MVTSLRASNCRFRNENLLKRRGSEDIGTANSRAQRLSVVKRNFTVTSGHNRRSFNSHTTFWSLTLSHSYTRKNYRGLPIPNEICKHGAQTKTFLSQQYIPNKYTNKFINQSVKRSMK